MRFHSSKKASVTSNFVLQYVYVLQKQNEKEYKHMIIEMERGKQIYSLSFVFSGSLYKFVPNILWEKRDQINWSLRPMFFFFGYTTTNTEAWILQIIFVRTNKGIPIGMCKVDYNGHERVTLTNYMGPYTLLISTKSRKMAATMRDYRAETQRNRANTL